MLVNFRQGIVSFQTTSDFLTINGNNVSLNANSSPCIINFAHSATDYLYIENESIPNAWVGPFNVPTWLYWDIDLTTGQRTFGKTTIEPTFGPTDPSPTLYMHFFNQKEMRMKVWQGNRWDVRIRVFAGKMQNSSTLILNPVGSQVNNTGERLVGSILFDSNDMPIRKIDSENRGVFYTTESIFKTQGNAATSNLEEYIRLYKSTTNIPAYSAVTLSSTGALDLASSVDMTRCIGITTQAISRDKFGRFISNGYITNYNWDFTDLPNTPVWVGASGQLTTTIPSRWSLQKIGFVVDSKTIFVKISDIMLIDGTLDVVPPTPSPTPTTSVTPTVTPTITITPTLTPTPTETVSPTPTATLTVTPTVSDTVTPTPTVTATPESTVTPTPTVTATPESTVTPTPTVTATPESTVTPTPTVTITPSVTQTITPTVTPTSGGGDPFFGNTEALLHFNGTDGSTTITDVKGHTFTAVGSAALETDQFKFGSASLYLLTPGLNYVESTGYADYAMASVATPVTIEFFIRLASAPAGYVNVVSYGTKDLLINSSSQLCNFDSGSLVSSTAFTVDVWHHVAFVYNGTTQIIFIDGVNSASVTNTMLELGTPPIYIGADSYNAFNGYMDEFRLTIGTARYTSNFTPPASPFPDS